MPGFFARHKRAIVIVMASLVLAGLAFAVYARIKTREAPAAEADTLSVIELASDDFITAERRLVTRSVPLAGSLNALKQVQVIAPYEGRILEVTVRPGDRVRAGQVLARFDEADLRARLSERRAALANAEEQLRVAERTRASNLALLNQNFISQNAFDNSLSGYAERRAAVDAQRSQLALIERALRDARLLAPFAGSVAARNVEPGQWVEANRQLFSLLDLKVLELEASVPAQYLAQLELGQRVSFRAEGYEAQDFVGTLVRISPSTQAGTRAVQAWVAVDNPTESLRAGLYASGHVQVGAGSEELRIPFAAVQKNAKEEGVWLIAESRLRWQAIRYERLSSDQVRVLQGLAGGERLVVTPLKRARAGLSVRLPAVSAS